MNVVNLTEGADVFTCNAFHVTGERSVLVDVGTMPGIEAKIDSLDAIVLTHQHGDHIGQLDAVLSVHDVPLYAYADHSHRTDALEDGEMIQMGDATFEVVYTPGHASDHVSFLSETALFSGDVVVYNDGAFSDGSFGRTDRPGQSREDLIESLRRLRDRMGPDVEYLYPGHGNIYEGDVHAVIQRALKRAERREPKYPE